ncbi:MAG: acetylxylan esterase, partial [Verrucomicrobiota bacterium]
LLPALCALLLAVAPSRAADTRADFLKLIDRPRVPLAAEISAKPAPTTAGGPAEWRFSFATDAKQRVPGVLLKPAGANGRLPVVILLHGTGGKKEDELPLMRTLAARGFIAIAIDGREHGERAAPGKTGTVSYQDTILRAWHGSGEHPFFYDTAWDVMRLVDWLETRDDVDAKRIGLYGVSKGGIETYLAAAVDPRIAVAVPCISIESFRWALDHDVWQERTGTIADAFGAAAKEAGLAKPDAVFTRKFYDKVAPGIYGEFDGPAMTPLIAPRPLLAINGELDPRTPPGGLKECVDAAQAAYHAAGADDRFRSLIEKNTAHKVTPEAEREAVEWFVRWLKPAPAAATP